MAQNLNYAYLLPSYNNSLDSSSFCYNNDPANCVTYGRLYTWSGAIDSAGLEKAGMTCGSGLMCDFDEDIQGVCPDGWHLPSEAEFKTLQTTAVNLSGLTDYGFEPQFGGLYYTSGNYSTMGSNGLYISSTESSYYAVSGMWLKAGREEIVVSVLDSDNKNQRRPVRCIKD